MNVKTLIHCNFDGLERSGEPIFGGQQIFIRFWKDFGDSLDWDRVTSSGNEKIRYQSHIDLRGSPRYYKQITFPSPQCTRKLQAHISINLYE